MNEVTQRWMGRQWRIRRQSCDSPVMRFDWTLEEGCCSANICAYVHRNSTFAKVWLKIRVNREEEDEHIIRLATMRHAQTIKK